MRGRFVAAVALLGLMAFFGSTAWGDEQKPQAPEAVISFIGPSLNVAGTTATYNVTFTLEDPGTSSATNIELILPNAWGAPTVPLASTYAWVPDNSPASSSAACPGAAGPSEPANLAGYTCHYFEAPGLFIAGSTSAESLSFQTQTALPAGIHVLHFYHNNQVAALPTVFAGGTTATEVVPPVSTVYTSDSPDCQGYGNPNSPGKSCFGSLSAAIAGSTPGNDVVIVGSLTADGLGASSSSGASTVVRGINNAVLSAPSACSVLLTLDSAGVTVRDLTIDGSACPAGTGIRIENNASVLRNLTVQNFGAGVGIHFQGTGSGTITDSRVRANNVGLWDESSGVVDVGMGPSGGNEFDGNGAGIDTDGGSTTIKGNSIVGGGVGVRVGGVFNSGVYGNRITGNSTTQVDCVGGGTEGAAWNYLGGTSPSAGSTCPDVASQLGADFVTWNDGGAVSGLSVSGADATFDLGANLPFGYGTTLGRVSNYYAVMGSGAGAIAVAGSAGQLKMYEPPNFGGVCPTGTEPTCWETEGQGRSQTGPGYYYRGTMDPTAVRLVELTAHAPSAFLPAGLAVVGSILLGGVVVVTRRN